MNDILTGAAQAGGADKTPDRLVVDTTTQTFTRDVLEESRRQPVLVDFWAPWCGPCRTLSPIIEETVRAAKGKVKLVKMNIDDHPSIANQLGIQSIPAVIAFDKGRPIDGFVGALPASQVKDFIDRLTGPSEEEVGMEALLDDAEAALNAGDTAAAEEAFSAVLGVDGASPRALAGLARALIAQGNVGKAKELLSALPANAAKDPAVAAATAQLALAEQTSAVGDPAALERRISENPKDHQARFDLALIANAGGDPEKAADLLLDIIRRDRNWNEDGARKQLLQFFDAWGPTDPATLDGRRRLSSVLFS